MPVPHGMKRELSSQSVGDQDGRALSICHVRPPPKGGAADPLRQRLCGVDSARDREREREREGEKEGPCSWGDL